MSQSVRILLGLLAGFVGGLLLAPYPQTTVPLIALLTPVGKLWFAALQMTVVPLVLSLLITGVAALGTAAASGRIAKRTLTVFGLFLAWSAAFGTLAAWGFYQLIPVDAALTESLRALSGLNEVPTIPPFTDWLQTIIPVNVVAALGQNAIFPVVVFGLMFAFALAQVKTEGRARMVELFQTLADALIVIVRGVLKLAPLGVCALIFPVAAGTGLQVMKALLLHIVLLASLCALVTLSMLPVAVIAGRQRWGAFTRAIWPAQAVALSTQSSLASLPATVECAETGLQMPTKITRIVLPLAVSLMRLTSPAKNVAAVMFIGWSLSLDTSALQLLVGGAVALVVSIGAVGLPGKVSFMGQCVPIAQAMGYPVAPLGLLMAVDLIPDMVGTVGNVTANLTAVTVVNAREGASESGGGCEGG